MFSIFEEENENAATHHNRQLWYNEGYGNFS